MIMMDNLESIRDVYKITILNRSTGSEYLS
jgi:hypothetical protein